MVDGLQGWGRVVVETVDREEHLWGDGLLTGGDVFVEGRHFVLYLDDEVV